MVEEKDNDLTFAGYLGRDFQLKIIWQLLVDDEFAEKFLTYLNASYFDDPTLKRFFIIIKEYTNEFQKVPLLSNKSIELAIKKYRNVHDKSDEILLNAVLQKIRLWEEGIINGKIRNDSEIVQKEAWFFIKQQEYKKLSDYINSKVKTGDIRTESTIFQIEDKIKKIGEIGDTEDFGVEVFEDISSALQKNHRNPIPTGIKVLDEAMGGGLGKSEVGIMLAPTGVGKTTFLTKVANTAFDMGKNVLQIIFEDTEDQVRRKHFGIWSKIRLSEFDENENTVEIEKRVNNYKATVENGAKLIIKKFDQEGVTIPFIKKWILRYQKKYGFKFDIVILDYLDCVETHRKAFDKNDEEFIVFKAFESMASEFDIPMWSALQTNRSGVDAKFVGSSQTGGSFKRVQKSHFFMSVAKTPEQKVSGLANISILKARFASDGHQFEDAIFDNDSMEIRIRDDGRSIGQKISEQKIQQINQLTKNIDFVENKEIVEPDPDKIEVDDVILKLLGNDEEINIDEIDKLLMEKASKQVILKENAVIRNNDDEDVELFLENPADSADEINVK